MGSDTDGGRRLPRRSRGIVAGVAALAVLAGGFAAWRAGAGAGSEDRGCGAFARYGRHPGTTVSVLADLPAAEGARHQSSYEQFTRCTGIAIAYEGSPDLEPALAARVERGQAPDLAYLQRPDLLATLAGRGVVREAPQAVAELVDRNWSPQWKRYGTVGGRFYAAPLGADVLSLVWYSPAYLRGNDLRLPDTWNDLITLSDTIASRGTKPWCDGFATGRAGTGWIEDVLLRTSGADTYDRWADHQLPFDAPQVRAAFDRAGTVLKNPAYLNGGHGDYRTVTSTPAEDAGRPILAGLCALHRGASSEAAGWGPTLKITPGGDLFAFALPPIDPTQGRPVLGSGQFAVAFDARPEVVAFQTYLASREWANTKAALGGWASANTGLQLDDVPEPIQKLAVRLLQDPRTTFRLAGTDLMPASVGTGSFPNAVNAWIDGQDAVTVTRAVERSWPKR